MWNSFCIPSLPSQRMEGKQKYFRTLYFLFYLFIILCINNKFQAFDLGNKGFLTEMDLMMALKHIVNHKDKIEIKNIFGVLDSSSARVNIQTFKENVLGYLQSEEHEYDNSLIKEVADINDNKLLNSVYNQIENSNRISPFKPNLISSPIIGDRPHHSLHEETFESLGEECSNIHNLEEVDCTVR